MIRWTESPPPRTSLQSAVDPSPFPMQRPCRYGTGSTALPWLLGKAAHAAVHSATVAQTLMAPSRSPLPPPVVFSLARNAAAHELPTPAAFCPEEHAPNRRRLNTSIGTIARAIPQLLWLAA